MPDGSNTRSSVTKLAYPPASGSNEPTPVAVEGAFFPSSDEKTVISKRPLASAPPLPGAVRPVEVGRSLVGESLGHFQLEEFVGGGGMGAVFRAIDTTLGRTVAVKVVSNQSADEDMLRRFRNEAQSAARLDHPNIARVYYVGEEKGWSYIVFEFIEGVNIRDLVDQRGPLPIEEVISYTLQISEALEHASERDVVHRDIKPSNILVMPDGRAKLVDMGLARLHQVDSPSQDLTETGVTLGTFDYISPEQARDPRSADVRSDLYSLGCTVYFMLTGTPPFPEGTVLQKLLSHSSDPPPDPRELRADLDDDLCAITLRLMAKLPGHRYQSPGELIDRLLVLSDRLGLPHERRYVLSTAHGTPTLQSTVVQHLPWILPAVLLVIGAFAVDFIFPPMRPVTRESLRPFPGVAPQNSKAASNPAAVEPSHQANVLETSKALTTDTSSTPSIPRKESTGGTSGITRSPATAPAGDAAGKSPESTSKTNNASGPTTEATDPAGSATQADNSDLPERNASTDDAPISARATNSDSANQVTSTVTGPRSSTSEVIAPNVLIVQPDVGNSGTDNPHVVSSLDAAFQKLATSPQVETIELRFRQRLETALTLAPRSKDGELTIRGGSDFVPLVVFRPTSSELRDRNLFKVIGGKVNFIGVHFRVELSSQVSDDWSLFLLKDTGRVTFTDCTLTIRNDRGGTATFFSIDAPSPAKTMMMPTETSDIQGPLVELKSCVIRGDANVVRAMNGLPFRLNWNQGFLATSQTAVVARGLRDNNGSQLINLNFTHITASLGAGLCLIDLDASAPILPHLSVQTNNCVWVQTDPEAPLVEHRGIENAEALRSLSQNLFRYGGLNNRYPSTRIMWRTQSKSGDVVTHRWRDPSPEMWYTEASIDNLVRWRRAAPGEGRETAAYSFHDFVLEPELTTMAGFDEQLLPEPREPDPESSNNPKPATTRFDEDDLSS